MNENSKFCSHCGKPIDANSPFCSHCGAKIGGVPAGQAQPPQLPEGVSVAADGTYRWVYEVDLWKNPAMLVTLLKVFVGCAVVFAVIAFFVSIQYGLADAFSAFWRIALFGGGGAAVLCLLGYAGVTLINGGKYCALFEMNEKSICHSQMEKQADRLQVLGLVAALTSPDAGTAAANLSTITKQAFVSDYTSVCKLKAQPKHDLIRLHSLLTKNQIYASPEQYAFVLDYLAARCVNAVKQ